MAAWVKVLLYVLGGVGAAGGTAYVTGLLDPWLAPPQIPPAAIVAPAPEASPPPAAQEAPKDTAPEAAQQQEEAGDPVTTAKQDRLVPPVFDILRVEPDGSVLVAGKAGAKATVEVLLDETVLGSAAAGEEGDFVIVLDQPLAPGDYRLALRATAPDADPVLSAGTAIVSIPEAKDGQVLAMVEEPGAPAQVITMPQVKEEAAAAPEEPAPAAPQEPSAAPAGEEAAAPAAATDAPPQQQGGLESEPKAEVAASPAVEEKVDEPSPPPASSRQQRTPSPSRRSRSRAAPSSSPAAPSPAASCASMPTRCSSATPPSPAAAAFSSRPGASLPSATT